MRIVGLIIILVAFMVGIGSNLPAMTDIPSAIIVIVGTLGMLLFSGASVGGMFTSVFSGDATADQLLAGAKAWRLAAVYAMASGAMGTIIGLVIMLKNMDDPNAIGPGFAIGILTILYGLFLAFAICKPLASRLDDRAAEAAQA
ncbi:MotA/TolQ/ExbB proton channel family protein [Candidatus Latescibacterota bacterium]